MSYTNETTHYGIPLPLGSDKTTPMDYNEAMQAVDTALFGAVTDATAGVEKANAVEEALGDTNDDVTALDERLTLVEGTQTTQGQAIQSNANRIEEVEDDALDMITAVDEGTAQVATVAVNKDKYFRYNNVLYIATQNIAIGDTIVPNTNCRATNVGTELEAQAEDITEVKSDLANVESELNKGSISVTSNGTKTWKALLADLRDLIDINKITDKSVLLTIPVGNDANVYHVDHSNFPNVSLSFTRMNITSTHLAGSNMVISPTDCARYDWEAGGYSDKSNITAASGITIKIIY